MHRRLKLLVARIGALGDVCMFAPVARALAARHEVHWLIRDTWVPAIRMAGDTGCRLVAVAPAAPPAPPFPTDFVAALHRERYDCLVDCSHWASIAWLARALGDVPVRAVSHDPAQDVLLGIDRGPDPDAGFTHVVPVPTEAHQVGKWRWLFREACGIDVEPAWPLPPRGPLPPGRPLRVFLHPHSSKREKIWPAARFARVLARAARLRPIECVVNGVRDRIVWRLRLGLLGTGVRLDVVRPDAAFASLHRALANCDLALGCDSGPLHVAALLGVPTLVVYGRYPAAEFGPPWRSTAVEPPSGEDAAAVSDVRVTAALEDLIARLAAGPAALERAA